MNREYGEELLSLLLDSERLAEIVRDDTFWSQLAENPSRVSAAVEERFRLALTAEEDPFFVQKGAELAACIAEMIDRFGVNDTRRRLQAVAH